MKKTILMILASASALALNGASTFAAEPGAWAVEITPYLWTAGIDAEVTVREKTREIDQKFSDLVDHVDAAASLLVVAQKDQWQAYAQGDYVSLSDDRTRGGLSGSLDVSTSILTGGFGYEFNGFSDRSKVAVLAGVRYTHMSNEVTLNRASSGEQTHNIVDALLILRPRFDFTDKFRFSPTLNVGAGDSDLTYELQPELQYDLTDMMSVRFGYRRVHYKEEFGAQSDFDGSLSGFVIGLGLTL